MFENRDIGRKDSRRSEPIRRNGRRVIERRAGTRGTVRHRLWCLPNSLAQITGLSRPSVRALMSDLSHEANTVDRSVAVESIDSDGMEVTFWSTGDAFFIDDV
jgi:hypothetical protein